MADKGFQKQIAGYGLTTAQIHYRLPDRPSLLQLYVWQDYDMAPEFPVLQKFLDFWRRDIEGVLHSVQVAHQGLIRPADLRVVNGQILVH